MNGASRRTQGNQMLENGKGRSQNNPMPTRSLKQRSLKQRRWMNTCFGNWFLEQLRSPNMEVSHRPKPSHVTHTSRDCPRRQLEGPQKKKGMDGASART